MSSQLNDEHRAALTIQHIGVTRIEGIGEPYRLDPLIPGINLIHGPNAIGKSRTAAALQALIWPETSSLRAELMGNLAIAGDVWRVDIDGQKAQYQRNGTSSIAPELSGIPSSHRDRYLLTLHDLLRADNHGFAETIQREAAGGYDLNAVRSEMKLTSVSKAQPKRLRREHQEAAATTSQLQQRDLDLHRQELSLIEARADLAAAIEANHHVHMLQAAREHVDAVEKLQEARIVRESFEDPIGHMTGDEYVQVKVLQGDLHRSVQQRERIEFELAQTISELELTGFPENIPSAHVLPELRQARQEIAGHIAHLDACRERIGENVTDVQVAALDSSGLRELSKLTREYRDATAREDMQSELLSWLGGTDTSTEFDRLRQGTETLAKRLRIGEVGPTASPGVVAKVALMAAGLLIVVESIVLAIEVSPALLAVAVFAIPIFWIAFRMQASPANPEIEALEQEYARLGLESPSAWTPEAVAPVLDLLQARLANALLENEKNIRWSNLSERRQQAADDARALLERRQAMLEQFGVAPDDADPETIRHIATAIDQWRQASDALAKCRASASEAERQSAAQLFAINGSLVGMGVSRAIDADEASAFIDHLAHRVEKAQKARTQRDSHQRTWNEQIQPAINKLQQDIQAIFDRVGLSPDDAFALIALCERVDPCRRAQKRVDEAKVVVETKRSRLDDEPDLIHKSREEIERELAHASDLASRRDAIQKRISDVEAELQHAKRRTNLEEAIAREAEALDDLHKGRERDIANAAAWNVLEFVQSQNRDINRPAVFRAADDLLTHFTAGAFRLELDESHPPEFRAVETASQRGLNLDQLSSGTRVQLLMAVRLAFIEATERGPQLPLILDETLGNTDDIRANAIIDAAIEIARRGRQIIYFTAQQDEIAKWNARIAQHEDVPACATFDLAMIRGKASMERTTPLSWDRSVFITEQVPEGTDHEAARTIFNVSPVDLWSDHIHGVDLWYVIPDVTTLGILRGRGIRHWGQYRRMHQRDALKGIGPAELHERAKARADVIETVRRAWQHGRPRPITRQGLRDCGLVTDRFFDDVAQLSEELDGDCQSLIIALRDKRVSNYRKPVINDLDEYFRLNGFISDAKPLTDAMVRANVISSATEDLAQGIIDEMEIDSLLKTLASEPALAREIVV